MNRIILADKYVKNSITKIKNAPRVKRGMILYSFLFERQYFDPIIVRIIDEI